MTIAVIVLGLALAAAIAAVLVLSRDLRSSLKSERASFAAEQLAERNQLQAEAERDGFKAQAMKAAAEALQSDQRRESAERAANRARQELVNRVSQEVVAASPGDVVAIVDGLLSQPFNNVPTGNPSQAGSAGNGQG